MYMYCDNTKIYEISYVAYRENIKNNNKYVCLKCSNLAKKKIDLILNMV